MIISHFCLITSLLRILCTTWQCHISLRPNPPQTQSPCLLDQVNESIRLKRFSLKTEQSYVYSSGDFILFHNNCHPSAIATDEIRATSLISQSSVK